MTDQRPHDESDLLEYVRAIDVPAPAQLHRRVEQLVAERDPSRGGRRSRIALLRSPAVAGLLAGTVALAAAVALAVGLSGSGHDTLSVRETSALTLRPATTAAPKENPQAAGQLQAAVDGVSFPYWKERFGWSSTGERTDRVAGHTVRTVFYGNARGQRIGYAIVSGAPPPRTHGGSVVWRGHTPYRLSARGDARVVTWLRDGHLCVVAGRGVSGAKLLALASWDDRATAS